MTSSKPMFLSTRMLRSTLTVSVLLVSMVSLLSGCGSDSKRAGTNSQSVTSPTVPPGSSQCFDQRLASEYGIQALPETAGQAHKQAFCKYMAIDAPNGKPIAFFAQSGITDEQMIRAYNILNFYLESVPGSTYGNDKSSIANAMANNGATLLLLNGSDDGTNDPTVDGQPLYATELILEGSEAYINNDYENHRDAAFEEILHLMHDYGIGVSGGDVPAGALPDYTAAIDSARVNAMSALLWPTANVDQDTTEWIEELRNEGSLSQEYLASVIDSYYGYWGAQTETAGGMWGIYTAKTREDVVSLDPMGTSVVTDYFNPVVTYMARIDATYAGDFSLRFDLSEPYTYKSQYLINAQLTGALDMSLIHISEPTRPY